MPARESESIPGVEDQELAATAGLLPTLPNVPAHRPDRFVQAVRMLVERRAQEGWPQEDDGTDLAVFVLVDYPRKVGDAHGGQPFADPVAQGIPLLGHLFFASADASHGQFVRLPTTADAIYEWLEDRDLGHCPVVAAYRNKRQLVMRRGGIHDSARTEAIRDHEPVATVDQLTKALSHYHVSQVLTPIGCPDGVWASPNRYIPGEQPEKSIQTSLTLALEFWFRGVVRVESEDHTNIGRIDVRLLTKGANDGLSYWIILELKVIKSFTNTSSPVGVTANVRAIVKGIEQAASYRANRRAEEGMLEIYDLRKDKTDDLRARSEVSATLARYSRPPKVRVWPVFGSADDARRAGQTGI